MDTAKKKQCRLMLANGFMNANPVMPFLNLRRVTVVYSALTVMSPVRQYRKISLVVRNRVASEWQLWGNNTQDIHTSKTIAEG